ncbi:hypothetical protein NW759_000820 [Fusarium solani]|nr:hypothetical protein NW759_000820 [Fusarium solani]
MMASLQRRALRASHKSIARLLERRLMVNDTAAERQGNSSVMSASGHGPGRDRNGIAASSEEPMAQAEYMSKYAVSERILSRIALARLFHAASARRVGKLLVSVTRRDEDAEV